MVPDKFNMVDMGGIDLIMMQGEEVPGLYMRLVESITQCQYQCLYNWFFDGVVIPPAYVKMEVNEDDEVAINEGVTVSPDDVLHIYSLEPSPVDPEIIPLLAEENGVYNVPAGKDGFNPVTVDVPSYTPVINPLSIIENGTYNPPSGVDGYAPVTVDVPSDTPVINSITITENGTYNPPSGVDGYAPVVVNISGGSSVSDVVNLLNTGISSISLVPFYVSSVNPTGYVLSYSSQHAITVPAWAVFNATIDPVIDATVAYVRWTASQTLPQWVQIELPEAEKSNAFYIATVVDGVNFCKTYEVQASNDGINFTILYTETLENAAIGKYVALSAETIPYKYYRIVVTDSYSSTYSGLTSFFPIYIDL